MTLFRDIPVGDRFRIPRSGVVLTKANETHAADGWGRPVPVAGARAVTALKRWRITKGASRLHVWEPDYEAAKANATGGFRDPDSIVLQET